MRSWFGTVESAYCGVNTSLRAHSALTARSMATTRDGCDLEDTVAAMTVEDPTGVTPTTTVRSHADFLAEKAPFYQKRIDAFEQYYERMQQKVAQAKEANKPINIVMPDGKIVPGVQGVTTPFDIAIGISKSFAKKVIVAEVDGAKWDLSRPMEGDCALKMFDFSSADGKDVRSPSAHAQPVSGWTPPLRRRCSRCRARGRPFGVLPPSCLLSCRAEGLLRWWSPAGGHDALDVCTRPSEHTASTAYPSDPHGCLS